MDRGELNLSGMLLGAATSSYQIEGAVDADGRGPSIWDTLTKRPGAIADGSDGSVACDSYHRLPEDIDLLQRLGAQAYRFSVAWPRVQPTGCGPANAAGLDYYDRLVDGVLSIGCAPYPTLYHWDLPQPLEDDGGWPARDTVERFADYASLVAGRLGDRVTTWATLNEPWCSAFLGYAAGVHAPGRTDPGAAYAAAHHLLLGHTTGRDAVQAAAPAAEVGIVLNLSPVHPENPAATDAADVVDAVQNRLWLDALLDGSYPAVLRDLDPRLGDPDLVRPGDLDRVRGSADWLGVNYYFPLRIGAPGGEASAVGPLAAAFPGAGEFSFRPRGPRTAMGWEIDPSGLESLLAGLAKRAPALPLRVTENGVACPDDRRGPDGTIEDVDRIDYLREHLAAVARAGATGADVRAYLAWTLMDNFEWAEGYRMTFGLATRDRTPKRSFDWYADLARGVRVPPE